jgi:hypothetical protein
VTDSWYCGEGDLLVDDSMVYSKGVKETAITQACEEIDSKLGMIYETPIDISDQSTVDRSAKLLIKQIAIHLASGRMMMRIAATRESDTPNAYGVYLIREATQALDAIVSGDVVLPGVPGVEGDPSTPAAISAPPIFVGNADAPISLDMFEDYVKHDPYRLWRGGSTPSVYYN